ncbi:expressed protein [Phakopsora pachyrhizi]|uniref:Expressed protein n=1 Tax=Phakopsora pachyrhizi TaxID=170000 RepID=A0AAV0B4B5_PHAPC|nr:expressed protein [Phakopsora pachyrhizi]CAH7687668.1 expressed protein [Phakopsora pachyrhizi]
MNLFQSFEGLHAAVDMRLSAINRACETGKMDIVESKLQGILKKFILLVQAVDHPWQLDDGSIQRVGDEYFLEVVISFQKVLSKITRYPKVALHCHPILITCGSSLKSVVKFLFRIGYDPLSLIKNTVGVDKRLFGGIGVTFAAA